MRTIIFILLMATSIAFGQASTAPAKKPALVVFRSQLDPSTRLEIIKVRTRAATMPSVAPAERKDAVDASSTERGRALVPTSFEVYEVRLMKTGEPVGPTLWEYERASYEEFSSARMRYRVLSAALVGEYLFIAQKMTLGTSVVMVRVGDSTRKSTFVATKQVMLDDEERGPIVVSATFRTGATLGDSSLLINSDEKPEYRREIPLTDHFKGLPIEPTSPPQ